MNGSAIGETYPRVRRLGCGLMPKDAKTKARTNVRKAQAEFERDQERAQRERAKAREARRSRFAQAQREGLTMREIADETGLGFGRVAEILRGE